MSINANESIDPNAPELYSLTELEAACDTVRIESWEFYHGGDMPTAHVTMGLYKDGEPVSTHLEIFNVPADLIANYEDPRDFLYPIIEIMVIGADVPKGTVDKLDTADVSFKEGLKRLSEGLEESLSEVMDDAFEDEAEGALEELEESEEEME